jgi:ATP-dependent helicase/DNAse subunit B
VLPALEALDGLAKLVVAQASLRELTSALVDFCEAYLLQPGEGAPPAALLAAALEPLAADATCGALAGDDALRVIEEELLSLRATAGRFGDPAVFVGTVRDAAGLPFRAVRIVGLCEGALPSAPREDPVLPDALRRRLEAPALRTTAESALAQLHSLRRCVVETRDQIVLSAPRTDPDGSQRQPSAVFLEALAALGRPGSEPIDLRALQFAGFRPARKEAEARREASPMSAAAQLRRVARRRSELPLSWHQAPSLDLRRLRELKLGVEIEGKLDELVPLRELPGISTERSISASRLSNLLGCPHRFLWNSALGWDEPAELPATGALDPLTYGSLFHGTAEAIFKQHGEDIGARKQSIAHWRKQSLELADAAFDRGCEQNPMAGEAVREQQRGRLHRDVTTFIEHEWASKHRPVLIEHPFGKPVPVKLKLESGTLHVSGFIDRVDIEGDRTLVRDLKTGRSHSRRGDKWPPSLGLDLQLGLYGLVVKHLAAELGLPKKIAGAYVYVDRVGERERAFGDDYGDLEDAARVWLDTALQLLTERAFPRTTTAEDCKWCCFRPVCGDEAPDASSAALGSADGALAAFRVVRGGAEEDDDE